MFTALLDTSVLWPSLQRDFLLSLAIEGMYRPVWSAAILEELEYHETAKLIKRGEATDEAALRALRLVTQMRAAFDDAEVQGWEGLQGTYGLPDPDDEHVVAAAVVAGAGAIITHNLRDFPLAKLPAGIRALPPAEFAAGTVSLDPVRAWHDPHRRDHPTSTLNQPVGQQIAAQASRYVYVHEGPVSRRQGVAPSPSQVAYVPCLTADTRIRDPISPIAGS